MKLSIWMLYKARSLGVCVVGQTTCMGLNVVTLLRKSPSLLPSGLISVLDDVLSSDIDRKVLLHVLSMRFMGRFDPETMQYTDVGGGRGFSKAAADRCLKELKSLFQSCEQAYLKERAQGLIEGVDYNHFPSRVTRLFAIIIQGAATLIYISRMKEITQVRRFRH